VNEAEQRLDAIRAYVAVFRFLNLTLTAHLADADDGSFGAWFILHNGALCRDRAGLGSNDPGYASFVKNRETARYDLGGLCSGEPGTGTDWAAATMQRDTFSSAEAYAAMVRFLDAYMARGCGDSLGAAFREFSVMDRDGLPAHEDVADAWRTAWAEATRAASDDDLLVLSGGEPE
jgi:hypothetical protein